MPLWLCGCEPDSILGSVFFLVILKIKPGDGKFTTVHLKALIAFSKIVISSSMFAHHLFKADFTLKNDFKFPLVNMRTS